MRLKVRGIPGCAAHFVDAGRAEGEFDSLCLAKNNGTATLQGLYITALRAGYFGGFDEGAVCCWHTFDGIDILDRHRHAHQDSQISSSTQQVVHCLCRAQGAGDMLKAPFLSSRASIRRRQRHGLAPRPAGPKILCNWVSPLSNGSVFAALCLHWLRLKSLRLQSLERRIISINQSAESIVGNNTSAPRRITQSIFGVSLHVQSRYILTEPQTKEQVSDDTPHLPRYMPWS